MPIECVFLDAGGVLMHPNWARVAEALGRHGLSVPLEALAAAEPWAKRALDVPARVRANDDASRGRLFFDLVLERVGAREPRAAVAAVWEEVQDYHRRRNLWESVPPDALPSLERLRQAGLRLVVVSNANGTLRAHMERLGLARHFDHILDSHEEGVEKPDPRIFRIALERSGARPEATLHVGDLYHVDVVGARAAGLRAALLDPAGLYAGAECPRFPSLAALAEAVLAGAL